MLADVDRIMACLKDFMHGLLFRLHQVARFGTISNLHCKTCLARGILEHCIKQVKLQNDFVRVRLQKLKNKLAQPYIRIRLRTCSQCLLRIPGFLRP